MEKINNEEYNKLVKKVKDNLLYLHHNFYDNGEFDEKSDREYMEENWYDIEKLLAYRYKSGFEDGKNSSIQDIKTFFENNR